MTHQAGRELDARVAERVMGWESITDELEIAKREDDPECVDSRRWHRKPVWFKGNEKMACEECGTLPLYSTSIEAAWEIVEKLRQKYCCIKVYSDHAYIYECTTVKDPDDDHDAPIIFDQAETAPLAICLAALKAMEWQGPIEPEE